MRRRADRSTHEDVSHRLVRLLSGLVRYGDQVNVALAFTVRINGSESATVANHFTHLERLPASDDQLLCYFLPRLDQAH